MDNHINLTDNAYNKIKKVVDPNLHFFRVFVTGGGCSGFKYGFTLDEEKSDDDIIINHKDIKVLVDPISFPYIKDSTLEYKEDLMSSSFEVINPQAKATCGCGESFTL